MGTSIRFGLGIDRKKDHPHAYGDKPLYVDSEEYGGGSSPRVWGQDPFFIILYPVNRIIPTRMGTRKRLQTLSRSLGDHPHAYGDK